MMLLLLFGSFFLLLALGVPILFSMGMSAGVYYVVSGYPLMQFVQKTIGGVDSFTLLAIPFFLLAGDIMGKGGISKRMLRFANALVGPLTGGLAVTGVVSSAMFGTICGSAPATAASIGSIVAPDMEARGYSKRFTGSIIAASGLLGIIIPPSIVMVNYGATAGVSAALSPASWPCWAWPSSLCGRAKSMATVWWTATSSTMTCGRSWSPSRAPSCP